jgi:uncharacterized protein
MSIQENVQTVKDFIAAVGRGDKQGLLALSAEDIEWIIYAPTAAVHGLCSIASARDMLPGGV